MEPCSEAVRDLPCQPLISSLPECDIPTTPNSASCTLGGPGGDIVVGGGPGEDIPALSQLASTINFSGPDSACVIANLEVFVDITHTWIGELELALTHLNTGTTVVLWSDGGIGVFGFPCGSQNDLDVTFSDGGTSPPTCANPTVGTIKPLIQDATGTITSNPTLADFNGEDAGGAWTLFAGDEAAGCDGALNNWGLRINCVP